jgi:hypothetical protein
MQHQQQNDRARSPGERLLPETRGQNVADPCDSSGWLNNSLRGVHDYGSIPIRPPTSYTAHSTAELRLYTVRRGDAALPTIKNTTKKPLNVPLPGGKRLFLGPGKEGRIRARAGEHPAVAALVEAGELEIVPDAGKSGGKGGGGGSMGGGQGRNPTHTVFKSGDG